MDEKEALKILKNANRHNQMLGILPGSDISKVLIKALEDLLEYRAIGTVEECRAAIEKQRRKPVKDPYGTSYIWKAGYCPVCGCGVTARWNYCQCCGQKLSWEDA